MSKDKISDYNPTADNNTDVGGIGIKGSDPVHNMDNGLREIMSHLADMNAGTSPISDAFTIGAANEETLTLDKQVRFDVSEVSSGQRRVLKVPDTDGIILTDTGGVVTGPMQLASLLLGGSASENELSIYEEGTWTPVPISTEGALVITGHTSSAGSYTRIGNLVTCHFKVSGINYTDTGSLGVSGLPFPTGDHQALSVAGFGRETANSGHAFICELGSNASQIDVLRRYDNASVLQSQNSTVAGTITYMA